MNKYFSSLFKYIKDFGLAFISSLLVTLVTSFIINPVLASHLRIDVYGNLLTLCGYVAIVSATIGNSLNNVRLLDKNKDSEGIKNYNAILLMSSIFAILFISAISIFYIKESLTITFFLCIYVLLASANLYWVVNFRIQINYVRNLIYNCVVCVGYLLGLLVFILTGFWPIIYVAGQALGTVFLLIFTKLPREGIKRDEQFKRVFKPFIILCGTTFITQTLSLLDRFVLHPIVGETAVSQFSTAAFFGKGVGTLFGPIALVLLSYFVKDGFVITKKIFWKISFLGIGAVAILFIISIPLAPIITEFLYPTIYESAKEYIMIANIGSMLSALAVLLNPLILKMCNIKVQPIIQLVHGVAYFVLGILGAVLWGIIGFALACVVANLIKVVFLLFLGGRRENV